jgi:class 3 adenylate cyclase
MRTSRLAALCFVEIADFPALMAKDERAALELLAEYRRAAEALLGDYQGELADATGSELLLVFESAVSAVQYALNLFLASKPLAARRPDGETWRLRAGIHLGEIWREDARVFGNGVNVAARVMQEAGPGTLFVSEDIERQVATKLDLHLRRLPPSPLKNIDRRLVLFEIVLHAGEGSEATTTPAATEAPIAAPARQSAAIKPKRTKPRRLKAAPPSAADQIEKASKRLRKNLSATFWGVVLTGFFAWLWVGHPGFWFAAGGIFLGLLPFVSGLRKLIASLMELQELRKENGTAEPR